LFAIATQTPHAPFIVFISRFFVLFDAGGRIVQRARGVMARTGKIAIEVIVPTNDILVTSA